jgi:hypothetical protein
MVKILFEVIFCVLGVYLIYLRTIEVVVDDGLDFLYQLNV